MSVGIFALKVGLVAGVAGTAVVTPILLRNRRSLVTEVAQSAETLRTSELGSSESLTSEREELRAETDSLGLTSEEETQRASETTVDSREPDSEQVKRQTEREEVREDSPTNTEDLSLTGSQVSLQEPVTSETLSPAPSIKREEFSKKCFVVPAKSNNGDNSQLLTCYDEKNLKKTLMKINQNMTVSFIYMTKVNKKTQ